MTRWNAPHTLELFEPLAMGSKHVDSFRDRAINYERSTRFYTGCWRAKWEFTGEEGRPLDRDYAWNWALSRLGYHFEERLGNQVLWSGVVQEVDIHIGGVGRRYSIVELANRIRIVYTDSSGVSQVTGWYTDPDSIATYGQRDDEIVLDKDAAGSSEAIQFAQDQLARRAQPTWEPIGATPAQTGRSGQLERKQDSVVVHAHGYMASLHWRFLTISSGTYDVDVFLTTALSTDAEFVTAGRIEENTQDTEIGAFGLSTIWEGVKGVINLRTDTSQPPFVARVDADRLFNYYEVDPDPIYRWRDQGIVPRAGGSMAINPWLIEPHIFRQEAAAEFATPPGSWLLDGRDVLMEEVTMADGLRQPVITPAGGYESELRKAYEIRRGQTIRRTNRRYENEEAL